MPPDASTIQSHRIFNGQKATGEKTKQSGVRLFQRQFDYIDSHYPGNTSVLFRWLMDKFLTNEELRREFAEHLKKLSI